MLQIDCSAWDFTMLRKIIRLLPFVGTLILMYAIYAKVHHHSPYQERVVDDINGVSLQALGQKMRQRPDPKSNGKISTRNVAYFIPNAKYTLIPGSGRRITTCSKMGHYSLGDQISIFASLYGIARKNAITPVLKYSNPEKSLDEFAALFDLSFTPDPHPVKSDWHMFEEKHFAIYDPRTAGFKATSKDSIALCGYYQSWKYFKDVSPEIRDQLILKSNVTKAATQYTEKIIRKDLADCEYVKVGIDVRRSDVTEGRLVNKGYNTPPASYYQKAMKYFQKKYKKVAFIVCTNDIRWTQKHITGKNVIYAYTADDYLDFAVLATVNHNILSSGSLGWWAAWIANGRTVYYKYPYIAGSKLAKDFKREDHFPAHWVPIG